MESALTTESVHRRTKRKVLESARYRSYRLSLSKESDDDRDVDLNPRMSLETNKVSKTITRKSIKSVNQSTTSQSYGIQTVRISSSQLQQRQFKNQIVIRKNEVRDAVADLKMKFNNNINDFAKELDKINERYANDIAGLNSEFLSRMETLKENRERSIEEAKKKVFSNL